MKKIVFVIIASYALQIIGCATSSFCDPQSPSTLISTGNPVNIAAGAAQFTLCGAYNATKAVVERSKSDEEFKPSEAVTPAPTGSAPASTPVTTATTQSMSPEYLEAIRAQAGLAYGKR